MQSLEHLATEISERFLMIKTGIDGKKFRKNNFNNEELQSLGQATEDLTKRHIWIDDCALINMMTLEENIKKLKDAHGLNIVVIDYLQLMSQETHKTMSRDEELNFIGKKLKQMALEYKIVIIALSQVARSTGDRIDKIPLIDDLRVPSLLSTLAVSVLMFHRDSYYDENADPTLARVRIAKNRRGGVGECIVKYDPKTLKISEYKG